MTNIHFQIERDHKIYEIELEPSEVWLPGEVLVEGKRYHFLGERDTISWLQKQIPFVSSHTNITLASLKAQLTGLGARTFSSSEKVHTIATSLLSPKEVKIHALHQILEKKTNRRLALQKHVKQAKALKTSNLKTLQNKLSGAKKSEIQAYLQYMEAKKQFRGVVFIRQSGQEFFCHAYGPSDESGSLNMRETRFCIGSMTKQFTGAAIALLIQEGKIHLQTPIKHLLPSTYWSPKWENITVEDLLRHTSGLPCYGSSMEDELRSQAFSLDELIEMVKQHELYFHPGEMNFYSNDGYVLLGAILENLSGMTLEAFMRDRIFAPAGMTHSGLLASYHEKTVATGFREGNSGLQKIPTRVHLSKTYAAGSMISTVDDLAKWDEALYNSSIFSEKTKAMMFSCPNPRPVFNNHDLASYTLDTTGKYHPIPGKTYKEIYYGFGVGIAADENIPNHKNKGDILWHNGDIPGFCSYIGRYIPSKSCIIVLENNHDVETKEAIQDHLEKILFS